MDAVSALTPVGGDGTTRVRISMPFDRRHSADLRQGLIEALDEGSGPVLVDISASTVVDQTGFTTLVAAHARAARAGRRLRYIGADERTRRLLRRARLSRLIQEEATSTPPVTAGRARVPRARAATG